MMHFILARGGNDGWGGLVVVIIVVIGWIVKAISEAVKQASAQSPPRRSKVVTARKPVPSLSKRAAAKPGKMFIAAPSSVPTPLPPVAPAAPVPVFKPLSISRKPASKNLKALQNRIVWAEVLGKPLALRDES